MNGRIATLRRRLREDEEGLSLVEIMFAILILTVAVLALASTAGTSLQSIRDSRDRQNATQIASSSLEDMRAMDWRRLAIRADTYGGPADFEGEVVLTEFDGAVDNSETVGIFSVARWVTWVDSAETQKRATVIVEWQDGTQTRSVRESTLVAQAIRGLPVPDFILDPGDEVFADGVEGALACAEHTLTNIGETDSYSFQLATENLDGTLNLGTFIKARPVDLDGDGNTDGIRDGFRMSQPGGPWFGWAEMGDPLEPMVDVGTVSPGRPDSAQPVGRDQTVPLTVCYTPREGSTVVATDTEASFVVLVFSAFDENVVRRVRDNISMVPPGRVLYLHHPSKKNGDPETNAPRLYPMDIAVPTRTDASLNYDSGSERNPGLRLADGATSDITVWDHQFDSTTTIGGDVALTLFVADDDALASLPDGSPLSLRIRLHRLNTSKVEVGQLVTPVLQEVTPVGSGWAKVQVTLPLAAETTFASGEFLRLELLCDAASQDDCHVHYDVNQDGDRLMSRLVLTVVP